MSLWESSFELMLMGMGTVFFFLILLVFVTMSMSAVINKFFADEQKPGKLSQPASNKSEEIAAVAAVVYARSKQHKK